MLILIYSLLHMHAFSSWENPKVYAKLGNPPPWCPWTVTGMHKLVVVCVEFSNVVHSTDASTIRTRVNTVAEYFHNSSFGRISINVTFFGDHWERLNNTMEYYGQDANGTHDVHGENFIADSIEAWNNFVNFSEYDCLLVIHAGEDQSSHPETTELLWRQNYCNLGRASKRAISVNGREHRFWGMAYDSEFEEWGLIAHEFGHSLGLPDLYIENESLAFDGFSLMARGDRNGVPEGTCPAPLDGFSMHLLGWSNLTTVTLNSTEDVVKMKPLGCSSATLLKIPLSESEYYLVEVREKAGNDKYTVSSTSVIVYIIDEMKESKKGIATVLTDGVVTEGSTYSDAARNVFVSFISFNSSEHLAIVAFSAQLFFVDVDLSDSVECFLTATVKIHVFDSSNNPVVGVPLSISIGENHHIQLLTDSRGQAEFQFRFGFNELGTRHIKISSPYMLAGEKEKEILVVFPWTLLIIVILIVALASTLFYIARARGHYFAENIS